MLRYGTAEPGPLMRDEAAALSVPRLWTGREIGGDRPDRTLAARREKTGAASPLPKKEVKLHSSLGSNLLTADVFLI